VLEFELLFEIIFDFYFEIFIEKIFLENIEIGFEFEKQR